MRIADPDTGELLPAGRVGTIYFERHDGPLFTYHNDPEKTRASRHPEHDDWGTTGDLGYLDDDGWLYLTDRKAFMIISGGVNIYPRDAEDALALHPAVLDVAVIGVPDAEMGEAVLAVVQPAPDAEPGPELELRADRARPHPHRRVQGPPARGVHRRHAAHAHRQAGEAEAPRPLPEPCREQRRA